MVSDLEWQQEAAENFYQEEEQKVEKDFRLNQIMIKLQSLKKNSHFETVLKHKVVNSDLYAIYRTKNFIKKSKETKKLYISFVMKKKNW